MWLDTFNEMRKKSGMSLDEISAESGVPKGTLSKITSGITKAPPLETMRKLVYSMGYTLADLDEPPLNRAAENIYSKEALRIADAYDNTLDPWGRQAVRELVSIEVGRCEDDAYLTEPLTVEEEKVIPLFLEPSAAGIASPTQGQDYELYTLGKDDPPGASYAVRIQGDSMEPYYPDGSIVFVNHDALRDGEVGIFCVDGGTVCKQYHQEGPAVYLFSLNRKRTDADVVLFPSSNRPLYCQGRVMGQRRYPIPGK